MIEKRDVEYVVDENLPPAIVDILAKSDYRARAVQLGKHDEELLDQIRRSYPTHSVMITGDHAMRDHHREALINSGASVAWLRANDQPGLTQINMATAFVIAMHQTLEKALDPVYFDLHIETTTAFVNVAFAPRTL